MITFSFDLGCLKTQVKFVAQCGEDYGLPIFVFLFLGLSFYANSYFSWY